MDLLQTTEEICNSQISSVGIELESKTLLSSDIQAISVSLKVEILLQYLYCPPCATMLHKHYKLSKYESKAMPYISLSFYPSRATNTKMLGNV